jgi:hypothetical protein
MHEPARVKKSVAGCFFKLGNGLFDLCVDVSGIPVGFFSVELGRFQFAWRLVLKGISSMDVFAKAVEVDRDFILAL